MAIYGEFDENKACSDLQVGRRVGFLPPRHYRASQVKDNISMGCNYIQEGAGGQHSLWLIHL
jgi:hypothetical protein